MGRGAYRHSLVEIMLRLFNALKNTFRINLKVFFLTKKGWQRHLPTFFIPLFSYCHKLQWSEIYLGYSQSIPVSYHPYWPDRNDG